MPRSKVPAGSLLKRYRMWPLAAFALACNIHCVLAADGFIILQSTTSTQNSGLYDYLLPIFSGRTGIEVRVVAVGTGQALRNARNGDGDVLLVHAKTAEEAFVADGHGVERFDVMYNDFVLVGPAADLAGLRDSASATAALGKIASHKMPFVSRGDDSGTHKKELSLWAQIGLDVSAASGSWYRETGSGMGATLNVAVGMGAYALTDRGTWIGFKNKAGFEILFDGDPALFNQYGVILTNPTKHPQIKARLGQRFIDWVLGPEGQQAIAAYRIAGQTLFHPNAAPR